MAPFSGHDARKIVPGEIYCARILIHLKYTVHSRNTYKMYFISGSIVNINALKEVKHVSILNYIEIMTSELHCVVINVELYSTPYQFIKIALKLRDILTNLHG